MLARARGSERRGVVICKVLGVQREREVRCKCLKYVKVRGRESERRVWCVIIG